MQRGELRFEDSVSFAGKTFAKQPPDASGQCLDVGRIVPQDKMDVVGVLRLLPLVEGKGLNQNRGLPSARGGLSDQRWSSPACGDAGPHRSREWPAISDKLPGQLPRHARRTFSVEKRLDRRGDHQPAIVSQTATGQDGAVEGPPQQQVGPAVDALPPYTCRACRASRDRTRPRHTRRPRCSGPRAHRHAAEWPAKAKSRLSRGTSRRPPSSAAAGSPRKYMGTCSAGPK